ncbi:MAG TPA: DMT family transporter [Terriglobales bacterium]|nr:DMT family transporter [Terriglobales bacterium]
MTGEYISASLSLAAAAAWGAGDFTGGLGTKGSNAFGVVVVAHGTGLIFMLAMAILTGDPMPSQTALLWGVGAGLTGGLGLVSLYKALAVGHMGINAPIAAIITAALPVVFGIWNEGLPSGVQLVGFGIAAIAIWLIALPNGELGRPRGLGLAVIAGVGFGAYLICSKQASHEAVYWPLAAARAASIIEMFLIIAVLGRPWQPVRKFLPFMMFSGVMDSVGNALFVYAVRHGRLDVATVLSSLYPATTVILAWIVLKERAGRLQRVGMFAALIAVPLIAR